MYAIVLSGAELWFLTILFVLLALVGAEAATEHISILSGVV